jgi:hypothetical protein
MTEIDKLVENYFAPRSKTITKKMLYEMIDEVLEEKDVKRIMEIAVATPVGWANKVVQSLKGNFPDAEVKVKSLPQTEAGTIEITNMGGPKKRDEAVKQISEEFGIVEGSEKKYRQSDYNIGAKLVNGPRFLFKNGRNTLEKENITLEALQELLKILAEKHGLENMRIKFSEKMNVGDEAMGQKSVFYDVTPTADNIKSTPKADFVIGDKIYISHKAGKSAKDFGQWSGVSSKSGFSEQPAVKNFEALLKKVLEDIDYIDTDKPENQYPNAIDFQKDINEPNLLLKAVFGKKYDPEKPSSEDNVDFVLQGEIDLIPELDGNDETTEVFDIRADRVFAASLAAPQVNPDDETDDDRLKKQLEVLKGFFSEGYLPVLSARFATKRKSFNIKGARATIYTQTGRYPNFIFTPESTPSDFDFVPHELNKAQLKNVKKFFAKIQNKESTTYDKMSNSIINLIYKEV